MTQLIGWIGNAYFVAGAAALTMGAVRTCAILNVCGNALYFFQSYMTRNWSLLCLSVILGTLSIAAAVVWG